MIDEQKKIFIVDDSLENLNALKNTMKDIYQVYPIPSALEMFNLLEHVEPDLILLDIEMPQMNGFEAAKKLKSDNKYKQIPIIFLTYMNDNQSEIEGLKLGAVDYIRKPYAAPLLLQRIKIHLSFMEQQKIILDRNKKIEALLEIKTKEVSLRETAELEAQNASRIKGEFLSHMSREIRSPLDAVMGMINIAMDAEDVQTIKHYLEKADITSKYVLEVINDILDMSKIEANKLELLYGKFDFGNMLANIIHVTSVRAQKKHQHIAVNINVNVPPLIVGDELRLSQVITNLLTNAIKYTPENGNIELVVEKIDASCAQSAGAHGAGADDEITLRISVSDNGIGISQKQQQKLFTSYNQEDGVTNKIGSTGLGLVISKRIVELMHGSIWVESELNKGTKFTFTIKAKKGTGDADDVFSDKFSSKSNETFLDFSKYKILAADDTEMNREILFAFLEKTGVSIDIADNGKKAVSLFTEHPDKYNLILLDINMPEMNGDEAAMAIRAFEAKMNCKQLLEHPKGVPIIAMTADVYQEDIEKCLSAGMDDHIAKPITTDVLYAKLKKYLLSS